MNLGLNMRNKIIAQILSLGLIFPAPIFAQEAEEPRFTQLEQGEEAPFAGTLFNPSATAKLIANHQYSLLDCDLRVQYEVDRTRSAMQLQLDSLQISYDAFSEKHNLLMDIKNNEINTYREMALKQPNDNSHWWLVGGVVVGIGLSLGTFYAVTEINE
jgi:Ni/Co efflux regulator RcnB|tara:strand:- start:1910 stop:2383 length:474 start_codon:yes stop_codon:yes gene_type:complete